MKKFLIVLSILVASVSGFAQPFLGLQANNIGGGFIAGYQAKFDRENTTISAKSLLFTVGFNAPIDKKDNNLYFVTAGYVLAFTDRNSFTITGSAGPAMYKYPVTSKYKINETDAEKIVYVNKVIAFYNLEIGKDWNLGRLFINLSSGKSKSFGGGFKVFLN